VVIWKQDEEHRGGLRVPIYVVPKALRDRLGEEATEALVEFLRQVNEQNRTDLLVLAEERLERRLMEAAGKLREEFANAWAKLREEFANAWSQLRVEIGTVRAEVREEITDTRAQLREEIANTRAELIKWMFLFWVGQVGVILGILFAWFRR
jgi:gas vesicle protein